MGSRTAVGGPEEEPILFHRAEGPVAHLVLNRPAQRNALSGELLADLERSIVACSGDPAVRAIVVAGRGPAFSAGHDLRELARSSAADVERLFRDCARVMQAIREAPKPVIARVHGIATAAGCQLVAACDLAVAAESATFATPGVNIGLFCSTPAVPLVRAIGRKRALEMLLTGEPIDARTALDWGLVNRVVPDAALDEALDRLLEPLLRASAHTIALGKQGFYRQVEVAESEAYRLASGLMCENAASEDAREGIDAFLGKRTPRWPAR